MLPSYVDKNTLTNSLFYNISIDGVYAVLQTEPYYDVLISCVPDSQSLGLVSDGADTRNVDGIIAIGHFDADFVKEFEAKEIPVVLMNPKT